MTQQSTNPLRVDSDADRGRGDYAAFHALWPLAQMGVVSDLATFHSDAWDGAAARLARGQSPTRVALIDTSVAAGHPNLVDAIDTDRAVDFFAHSLGVAGAPEVLSGLLPDAGAGLPEGLPADVSPYWDALLGHLRDPRTGATAVHPATLPSFSAHGTAMAGLTGARPVGAGAVDVAPVRIFDPVSGRMTELPGASDVSFAFAGVDPFCRIVPISTHFDPEPLQLINAMLYAVMVDADVIVLARDFPSPESLAPDAEQTLDGLSRALGVGLREDELTQWRLLAELTLAVSQRVPLICAGGNGAQAALLNPASLAAPDNGIIAVGAATAAGQTASYSPDTDAITVYAPSGDGERLDRALQRLDVQSAGYNPHDHGAAYLSSLGNFGPGSDTPSTAQTHAPQDLISTDVPGRAGYNSSPNAQVFGQDGAILDYRSAYCRFSGTSGAVALTAGLVSLAMSAGRIAPRGADTGIRVKAALTGGHPSDPASATPRIHWSTMPQSEGVTP